MPDNSLKPVLGIDLGTTFSCVARWADTRPEVYKLKDGNIIYVPESKIEGGATP